MKFECKELICKHCRKCFDKDRIHYQNSSGDVFCSKKCALEDLEKIDVNKPEFMDWMSYDDDFIDFKGHEYILRNKEL